MRVNLSEVDEDQNSISRWASDTFGGTSEVRAVTRVNQEVSELLVSVSMPIGAGHRATEKLRLECADILITLFRVADVVGFDLLLAVDDKMKINRNRKWKLDGSGCGQHIEDNTDAH